jgi:hypothetical protein
MQFKIMRRTLLVEETVELTVVLVCIAISYAVLSFNKHTLK